LEELASVYALEAFLPEERRAYLTHLGACSLCRRLAAQHQAVADLLPDSLEERPARPELKQRVLAQATGEAQDRVKGTAAAGREGRLSLWGWLWPMRLTPAQLGAASALAAVIVGLVVWNVLLQLRLSGQEELTSEQRQVLEAIAAGARVLQLSGTEAAPGASGSLVSDLRSGETFLLARNLPRIPADRVYQVWRITGGSPSGAGTFSPANGAELVTLSTSFSGTDAVGVSIEPRGGSLAPSGAIVLLGAPPAPPPGQ
jgi:anti-sigma-K factor RskA